MGAGKMGIAAFDEAIDYGECVNDGGAACPSVDWELVEVEDRGEVLQVSHGADFAGLFFKSSLGADMTDYAEGGLRFDIRVLNPGMNTSGFVMKVDCFLPMCASGDQAFRVYRPRGLADGSGLGSAAGFRWLRFVSGEHRFSDLPSLW